MSVNERKYQIDTVENKEFLKGVRKTLLEFGARYAAPDGTAFYLGDDGTPWTDRPRATYETCRFAHSYVLGYLSGDLKDPGLALSAMNGLTGAVEDKENGGWYEGLNADGCPQEGKLCYTHAFVILAASSLLTAVKKWDKHLTLLKREDETVDPSVPATLLKNAEDTYTRRFWDPEFRMAFDNWDTAFSKLSPYRGLNANMHSVEAYLADFDVTGNEEYHSRAKSVIDRVSAWAAGNDWRIPEHYSSRWKPELEYNRERPDDQFKPYGATPGHGIEWARLITQFGLSAYPDNKKQQEHYISLSENLFGRAVSDAWSCDTAPGIVYTTDWSGKPIVHERMHWVLAEAINTSAVLLRVTGKDIYADWYSTFMEYLDRYVLDHEHGSWYHELDQQNHVSAKVWPGKPDLYHAIQATLIPYADPSLSIAVALAEGKVSD